jgi:hypothetical protein
LTFGSRPLAPPFQRSEASALDAGTIHFEESQYYTIEVENTVNDDGKPLQALRLDHLLHSFSDLQNPKYLSYGYLRVFNDVLSWKVRPHPLSRVMFIGGGGYTLPRLAEINWPGLEIDVVEIDPAVTRVAHRYFGIPRETAIRSINQDARWFAMRSTDRYDVIFIDAFNDLSVPYHLTTREFAALLRRRLAPNGAIVVNVIDNFERGRFLASYTRTLQGVFGNDNVAIIIENDEDMGDVQSTYVVIASPVLGQILGAIGNGKPIPGDVVARYVRKGIVLTDDYVPVDNMLAPLFAERFAEQQSAE